LRRWNCVLSQAIVQRAWQFGTVAAWKKIAGKVCGRVMAGGLHLPKNLRAIIQCWVMAAPVLEAEQVSGEGSGSVRQFFETPQ
jgi:hypothetical protein